MLGGINFNRKYSIVVIGEFDVWLNHMVMPPNVLQTSHDKNVGIRIAQCGRSR